jgi:peptidoglycan/LPS O-acetylase OafA/YrhL
LQALRPSIPALTSLRFFAALVVVLNHYDARQALLPFAIFDRGYEAVTFFFVLSGFILTYVHCTGPDLRQLNISSRVFMVARAARILPAYYLALGLAAPFFLYSFFVAQTLAWPQLVGGLIAVPLLLQAWYPPTAVLWNTPAWSLSVEAFFYALFPAICRLMGRSSAISALSLSFLAVVATSLLRQHFFQASSAPFGSPWHSFCAYFPAFHLPQFIFGMALGRCFIKYGRHSGRAHEMLMVAGVIGLVLFCFSSPTSAGCSAIRCL